jgi:hypothetical protein
LVHSVLVAVHGIHHEREDRIEDLARLLGIAVSEQLHRALEVGEEHGDLFAFSLERCSGRQDFLGEVLGSIAVRKPRRCARSGGNGMSTLGTELRRCRQLPAALGAAPGQRRGAFLAELRARLVLVLARGHFMPNLQRNRAAVWQGDDRPLLRRRQRAHFCLGESGLIRISDHWVGNPMSRQTRDVTSRFCVVAVDGSKPRHSGL